MFGSGTPQDQILKRLDRFDKIEELLAEANHALAELRRSDLEHNANLSNLIGELAKIVVASNDTMVNHHGNVLGTMKAQSANRVLRQINSEGPRLFPLQKEFPSGNDVEGGVHLATTLCPPEVNNWQIWPPIAIPMVGEYPPDGMFPASLDSVDKMDHEKILRLIAFYNDNFAIQYDDPLELRVLKFKKWCTCL